MLTDGMCGAPVVLAAGGDGAGACIGAVEGIVPADGGAGGGDESARELRRLVVGHAAFVHSDVLRSLIKGTEGADREL